MITSKGDTEERLARLEQAVIDIREVVYKEIQSRVDTTKELQATITKLEEKFDNFAERMEKREVSILRWVLAIMISFLTFFSVVNLV